MPGLVPGRTRPAAGTSTAPGSCRRARPPAAPARPATRAAVARRAASAPGRWKPPVTTTTGRSPASATAARTHARHVLLARGVVLAGVGRRRARRSKYAASRSGAVVGRDLEQVVPQRVHVVDRERPRTAARSPRRSRSSASAYRLLASGERRVPRGQVDEPHLGARPPRPSVSATHSGEYAQNGAHDACVRCAVAVGAEDRDRQLVAEQQLVEPVVEVGRSLDQHVRRAQRRRSSRATSRAQAGLWCRTPTNVAAPSAGQQVPGVVQRLPVRRPCAAATCCSR